VAVGRRSCCCRQLSQCTGASVSDLDSVSHPRSSNRTCGFPAYGSPTGFTSQHTQAARHPEPCAWVDTRRHCHRSPPRRSAPRPAWQRSAPPGPESWDLQGSLRPARLRNQHTTDGRDPPGCLDFAERFVVVGQQDPEAYLTGRGQVAHGLLMTPGAGRVNRAVAEIGFQEPEISPRWSALQLSASCRDRLVPVARKHL